MIEDENYTVRKEQQLSVSEVRDNYMLEENDITGNVLYLDLTDRAIASVGPNALVQGYDEQVDPYRQFGNLTTEDKRHHLILGGKYINPDFYDIEDTAVFAFYHAAYSALEEGGEIRISRPTLLADVAEKIYEQFAAADEKALVNLHQHAKRNDVLVIKRPESTSSSSERTERAG